MRRLLEIGPVALLVGAQRRYGQDYGGYLVAAIAYYGFLSLFPLLLLAVAVLGFVLAGDPALQQQLADGLADAVPGLGPLISQSLDAVVGVRVGAGLVGLAGLLWSGTALVQAAGFALSRVFRTPMYKGFVKTKVWALGSTLGLGTLALSTFGLAAVVGNLRPGGWASAAIMVGGPVLVLGLDLVLFLVAYRVLTERPGPTFGELWPGALTAAAGWSALKLFGAWYGTRAVAGATAVFGAFASAFGMLVLLYLAGRLFVLGAEVSAVHMRRRGVLFTQEQPKGGASMATEQPLYPRADAGNGKPLADRSTVELIGTIASDGATLVRQELQLAKQEILEAVTARLKAAAAMAVAGGMGLFVLVFVALAAATALDGVMAPWASRLVVAAGFGMIASGAAALGLARLSRTPLAPEETARTIKEDVEWAKAQLTR